MKRIAEQPLPELLAPAGTLEAFEAAVRAGADAVYVGAPAANARNLARHFTLAEIAAMVDHGRQHGVRTYIAMNSLVREDELDQAGRLLAMLDRLGVDAVILQDLGLNRIVREHFPNLAMHASTLMGAHNSLAVNRFSAMGFTRVVLARELTVEEIGAIARRSSVEMEVFVHGAMCFSYSGLCLFSSYYGGKSGLRGRCVQPCRRRYQWGRGRGGYIFSMRDLEGIGVVGQLHAAGVRSLKIEGRMRSSRYVENVVRAYRLVLDHPGDRQAMTEAEGLLRRAMGRRTSTGFFLDSRPARLLSPDHSGNTGIFLGRVKVAGRANTVSIVLQDEVQTGDRLRLHREKSGERSSFTLRQMWSGGRRLTRGRPGQTVSLELAAKAGDSIYKVDSAGDRRRKSSLDPGRYRKLAARLQAETSSPVGWSGGAKKAAERRRKKGDAGRRSGRRGARSAHADRRRHGLPGKGNKHNWYLRTDDAALCRLRFPRPPAGIMLLLSRRTVTQLGRRPAPNLILALPPVIEEKDVAFYRETCRDLVGRGYRKWQIAHIGQLELFPDLRHLQLYGHYTLNVLNSQAARTLVEQGLAHLEILIETDRDNLAALLAHCRDIDAGLTVYGWVPLFTARAPHSLFATSRVESPRREAALIMRRYGQTVVTAADPVDLRDRQEDIHGLGVGYTVIDLVCCPDAKRAAQQIFRRTGGPGRTFNYEVNLA